MSYNEHKPLAEDLKKAAEQPGVELAQKPTSTDLEDKGIYEERQLAQKLEADPKALKPGRDPSVVAYIQQTLG